jgi:hypothetical protein
VSFKQVPLGTFCSEDYVIDIGKYLGEKPGQLIRVKSLPTPEYLLPFGQGLFQDEPLVTVCINPTASEERRKFKLFYPFRGALTMLQQLKNLDTDNAHLDELVALLTFGQQLQTTYATQALEAPDWLDEKMTSLRSKISTMRKENLERALKNVQSKKEALKTAEEKRVDLASEEQRLKKALGLE